jgi:Tol biopolymer transport system component
VYIRKTDGSPAVLLGEGGARALSPDGKWVIAVTQGSPRQLKLLTTGAGEPKDLTNDNINHAFAHWFPDGKRILFSGNEPGKGERLYVYEMASGKSQAITPEGVNGTRFVISPDSQWVAGIGPDQKGYLYPVGGGEPRMINGLNPGEQPITFSSDGRSLYSTSRVSCRPRSIASICKPGNALRGSSSCRPIPLGSRISARFC